MWLENLFAGKEKRISSVNSLEFNSKRNLISRFSFQLELKRFNSNLMQVKFIHSRFATIEEYNRIRKVNGFKDLK